MTPVEVANITSGLFMVAQGAFVLSVRPRRPGNVAFVLFSAGFGLSIAISNWGALLRAAPILSIATAVAAGVAAVAGLVGMMLAFPTPLAREQRWTVFVAVGAATAASALTSWLVWGVLSPGDVPATLETLGVTESAASLVLAFNATLVWLVYTVAAYLFVIAFRVAASPSEPTSVRHQYVLVSFALLLYVGYVAGGGVDANRPVFPLTPYTSITTGLLVAAMLGLAVVWLRETVKGRNAPVARNVALLALALPTLGLVLSATAGAFEVRGVLRAASVVILAYAMLRHQLLGLDVKVRWTISKSAVAAVFVAVFFVASEAAQQFFGDALGGSYVGIAAAGMLVFAMAPLQNLANRMAEKAVPPSIVPVNGAHSIGDGGGPEPVYRAALHAAMRDGLLTRREEIYLAEVAERLGIGARRALELRSEAEQEAD